MTGEYTIYSQVLVFQREHVKLQGNKKSLMEHLQSPTSWAFSHLLLGVQIDHIVGFVVDDTGTKIFTDIRFLGI